MRFKRLVFPLPYNALFVLLLFGRRPLKPPVYAAMMVYSFGLLPYVLISYYSRYATPLIAVKMLLVLFATDMILKHVSITRHRMPNEVEMNSNVERVGKPPKSRFHFAGVRLSSTPTDSNSCKKYANLKSLSQLAKYLIL